MALCHYITAICGNLRQCASAVILPPLSKKACPQALYVRIISVGCSYLYAQQVAYYLRYTSTLSTYLDTLGVLAC